MHVSSPFYWVVSAFTSVCAIFVLKVDEARIPPVIQIVILLFVATLWIAGAVAFLKRQKNRIRILQQIAVQVYLLLAFRSAQIKRTSRIYLCKKSTRRFT